MLESELSLALVLIPESTGEHRHVISERDN